MHRRLQFDMRENPASDRRHGSRSALSKSSSSHFIEEENSRALDAALLSDPATTGTSSSVHAAKPLAATRGENDIQNRLLTIREVADLLHAPASWVYENTRQRSVNRIPGIRLGKYWRFERADVLQEPVSSTGDEYPLTVRQAAKFLGVSPQTVYLWVERKQIPHLRVMGRNIRFLKSELEPFRATFRFEVGCGKT